MGIARDLQRWQRIVLSIVVLALMVTGVLSYSLIQEMRAANQDVSYSRAERVIDVDGIEIAVFSRSVNMRGFLLTGDPLFLENRKTTKIELDRHVADLVAQQGATQKITDVTSMIARLDTASDRAIVAYKSSPEQARRIWETDARLVMEQLTKQVGELASVERAGFTEARGRASEASRSSARLLGALLSGVVLLVTLLFYGYTRATRALLARQKAEQEQATFRLLEQVPVGIFVLTPKGTPYYANQHAQKLLGRGIVQTSVDRLAETYDAYEAGTDRLYPTDRLPVVRALAGEVVECTDMEIRRGDEIVPLHVVGAPVHDVRGELLYAVAGFQDVRELQRLAMRDTLTGLANRAAINQTYARERAVSERAKRPFAIALIDLDRFKSINDTHGHSVGDEVLKRTASTIVASLRRSDTVGRWGGEELVVLLPNTDAAGARRALEKVLVNVRSLEYSGKDRASFSATFSAGAVIAAPSEALDAAIARADVLLYAAKHAGRNRVHVDDAVAP